MMVPQVTGVALGWGSGCRPTKNEGNSLRSRDLGRRYSLNRAKEASRGAYLLTVEL
jgi:hypothetical protein